MEISEKWIGSKEAPALLDKQLSIFQQTYDATVIEDFQFELDATDLFDPELLLEAEEAQQSLDDVLEKIGARVRKPVAPEGGDAPWLTALPAFAPLGDALNPPSAPGWCPSRPPA